MNWRECVAKCRGSLIKARRLYLRSNGLSDSDWYAKWEYGLADEVMEGFKNG